MSATIAPFFNIDRNSWPVAIQQKMESQKGILL